MLRALIGDAVKKCYSHDIIMGKPMTELLGVVCHMASHNVTCNPDTSERTPP